MKNIQLIFLGLFLLCSASILAQEAEVHFDGSLNIDTKFEKPSLTNLKLQQKLDAMALQNQVDLANNNYATGQQIGSGNLLQISQNGQKNQVTTSQDGSSNLINSSQNGFANSLNATQIGSENMITYDVGGESNKSTLIQKGNYNEIVQKYQGDRSDVKITQLNNGNSLILQENNYLNGPVSIKQSGDSKVIVNRSMIIK